MKKIKIFLGAYVNFPNAQNVNCDNIAWYLDKDKFEVHTMYTSKMPIEKEIYEKQGIHLHKLIHHRYIWYWNKLFTMLSGRYDIYYLPKQEYADRTFAKLMKCRNKVIISSVEGVVGEQIVADNAVVRQYFNELVTDYFSISACIADSVKKYWNKETEILYLGLNSPNGKPEPKEKVQSIIWIGSVIDRKRPEWFVACAKMFPQLNFIMIGDGDKYSEIQKDITVNNLTNIICMGRIPNEQVYEELKKADLLLMTSDKEGLPKVIGEAMISGVPGIYINECYDVDYIKSGINGFAVPDLETMKQKIQYLIEHPNIYQRMSEAAYESIQPYTWENVIKQYEIFFENAYKSAKERNK